MLPRHRRFTGLIVVLFGVSLASFFVLKSFQENLLYYFTPVQVQSGEAPIDREFRMGGLVVPGSFKREEGSLSVEFVLTDGGASIRVKYTGLLPDLFKEGQGIITRGRINASGVFSAIEVLAKHDENYMPPMIQPLTEQA